MRIDDRNIPGGGSTARTAPVETTTVQLNGTKDSQAAARGGDRVELSGLSRIFNASANLRSDRIRSLAAEVRGGRYAVDSHTVGKALVRETLANHAAA